VQEYLDEGVPSELLVDGLDQIRALVSDEIEETVLTIIDRLVGWCAPAATLTCRRKENSFLSLSINCRGFYPGCRPTAGRGSSVIRLTGHPLLKPLASSSRSPFSR
jgi:hypothetical protein